MQAEQRDGIGCAFAPVETGTDRSRLLLRRSDRAGDTFGRSRTVHSHHGRRRRDRLRPLARHRALVSDRPCHPIGEQKRRAKTAALADCGRRRHASGPFVSLYVYVVNSIAGDIWPALGALLPATFSAGHLKSAALSEGRAIVLWIAFVVIFHETLGWMRFAPPTGSGPRRSLSTERR